MIPLGSDIIAIAAALFCIWLLRPLAVRVGFVDRPGGRKQHTQATPLIGGIAIFFGFCFALLSFTTPLQNYRPLIGGSSLLLIMGITDDFRELNSKFRLMGQIAAALCLSWWGHLSVMSLGNLWFLGDIHFSFWAIPFTVVVIVGFLNAMNMIDGQDGLAGSVALGQVALLTYLAWRLQREADFALLIILGLLLVVFLIFNMQMPWRRHASIFLGDAGSTLIAFLVAWFAISIGQHDPKVIKPIVMLWILAFPVFDLLHVCLVRFIRKQPLLLASRDHFHHILHVAGVNVSISTLVLALFSFGLGLLGIILNDLQVPESWQFVGWVLALLTYLGIVKLVRDATE